MLGGTAVTAQCAKVVDYFTSGDFNGQKDKDSLFYRPQRVSFTNH